MYLSIATQVRDALSLATQCRTYVGLVKQGVDVAKFWPGALQRNLGIIDRCVAGDASQLSRRYASPLWAASFSPSVLDPRTLISCTLSRFS